MKRSKEVFWGLLLILGAFFILANKMRILQDVGIVTVIFTIFLVGILIENLFQRSFGGILFSLAFLGILYDRQLGIESLTPWPILMAALLGTIGLNMIFHKKNHRKDWDMHWKENGEIIDVEDEEQVQCTVRFGETTKYIDIPRLRRADLETSFGSLGVYFDQTVPAEGNAQAEVRVAFGSMELYIPKDWKVVMNVETVFGGIGEKGRYQPSDMGNTLLISGRVTFGSLEIHYI